jgi:hypothetical protein
MINSIIKYTVQEEYKLRIVALDIILMDRDKKNSCFLLIMNKHYIEIN